MKIKPMHRSSLPLSHPNVCSMMFVNYVLQKQSSQPRPHVQIRIEALDFSKRTECAGKGLEGEGRTVYQCPDSRQASPHPPAWEGRTPEENYWRPMFLETSNMNFELLYLYAMQGSPSWNSADTAFLQTKFSFVRDRVGG